MPEEPRRGLIPRRIARCATLGAVLALAIPAFADSDDELRAKAGVKIFRSLLQADENITGKAGSDGKLLLVFVYTTDRKGTEALSSSLKAAADAELKIKDVPVRIEITSDPTLSSLGGAVPAGLFIAQPPRGADLDAIIRYGIDHHVIVYSPIEGHVEAGVLGGLFVGAEIKPYINLRTLEASHIEIKPIYMKVIKSYE